MFDVFSILFSGILGGVIGAAASILAYSHGYLSVEKVERRKQKISLLDDLMAARYVLQNSYTHSDEERRDFNRALARIPHVFAENKEVIAAYDVICSSMSTENLIKMFQTITVACGLKQYAVSHTHIMQVRSIGCVAATPSPSAGHIDPSEAAP